MNNYCIKLNWYSFSHTTKKVATTELIIFLTINCTVKTVIITCSVPQNTTTSQFLAFVFRFFFFLVLLIFDHLSYSLPTDVMTTVFKVGAKTERGWSFLLSKYASVGSEAEKNKILEALASSEDVRKLYWYETTKGIWSIETKSIKAPCSSGGDPPFPPFAHRPDLTWTVWWGACMCRASSQGSDLHP